MLAVLVLQVLKEVIAQLGMLEGILDRRLQITQLAATVIAPALKALSQHLFVMQQFLNGVRELNFAASTAGNILEE